jgi:hypothetical protein
LSEQREGIARNGTRSRRSEYLRIACHSKAKHPPQSRWPLDSIPNRMEHRASNRCDCEMVSISSIISLASSPLVFPPRSSLRSRLQTYRHDLPRKIRRIRILLTLIRIIQNVPERSLRLRYRRGAGKRRSNCGDESERRTHDVDNKTQTIGRDVRKQCSNTRSFIERMRLHHEID